MTLIILYEVFFHECYRSLSQYNSDISGVTPVGLIIVQQSTLGVIHLLTWSLNCVHSVMPQVNSPRRLQGV